MFFKRNKQVNNVKYNIVKKNKPEYKNIFFIVLSIILLIFIISVSLFFIKSKKNIFTQKQVQSIVLSHNKRVYDIFGKGIDYEDEILKQEYKNFFEDLYYISNMFDENNYTLDKNEQENVASASRRYIDEANGEIDISFDEIYELYLRYTKSKIILNKIDDEDFEEISDSFSRAMEVSYIELEDKNAADTLRAKMIEDIEKLNFSNEQSLRYFKSIATSLNSSGEYSKYIYFNDVENTPVEPIFSLSDDDISEVIKTEEGYYLYYIINSYDEVKTRENKENIKNKRCLDRFNNMFNDFKKNNSIKMDFKNFNNLDYKALGNNVDFFGIYEEIFNEGK